MYCCTTNKIPSVTKNPLALFENMELIMSYVTIVKVSLNTILLMAVAVSLKCEVISLFVNQEALKECLKLCQFSLITRVVLSHGDTSCKHWDLKKLLGDIWQLKSWSLIC